MVQYRMRRLLRYAGTISDVLATVCRRKIPGRESKEKFVSHNGQRTAWDEEDERCCSKGFGSDLGQLQRLGAAVA